MNLVSVTNQEEFTFFSGFCGVGGGAIGFLQGDPRVGNLRGSFRCLGGFDVDPQCVRDFTRNVGVPATMLDLFDRQQYIDFHGVEPPPGWREAMPDDIRRAAGNQSPNIVFLSPPCLPADGLVLTGTGARDIRSIRAGDLVLTHRGRYRSVTNVGKHTYTGTMYGFRLNGTVDYQWFTEGHPLWIRRVVRKKSTGRRRFLDAPHFVSAKEVRRGDRVGFPIQTEIAGTARRFVESFGNPQIVHKCSRQKGKYRKTEHVATLRRIQDLSRYAQCSELWFLFGCYLGDGYRRHTGSYEVSFCVGSDDSELASEVRKSLDAIGIRHYTDGDAGPSNVRIRATGKHLHALCGLFGDGAEAKHIPESLMTLESRFVDNLIVGYRATDGSSQQARKMPRGNTLQARWKIPSVSLQLLRDMQRLLLRQRVFASIHKCWPGGPQIIMGRKVNTLPRWELNVRLEPRKRTVFEFDDSAVWVRVRDVSRRETQEEVWNLSVADDDTFCTPMIATHNCKGFSGLLSAKLSLTPRYQALNRLTLRGMWLMLEAFADDPPEFFLLENVPRIRTRGRDLLDQIEALLNTYGYAVAETTYDCGELGELSQSRKRFLLVARHVAKVPPFLYQPPTRPLRSVGEVLSRLPLPGDPAGGLMHRIPKLQWQTWARLAFIEAGSDWRSLNRLSVQNGVLTDYLIVPQLYADGLGVVGWSDTMGAVTANALPTNGKFSVADPRQCRERHKNVFRVVRWNQETGAITSGHGPTNGGGAVADPRPQYEPTFVKYPLTAWDQPTGAVIGGDDAGAYAVNDVRPQGPFRGKGKYSVTAFNEFTNTVIGNSTTGHGAFSVADPGTRPRRTAGEPYLTAGAFGVTRWDSPSNAVAGAACHDNGPWSVAEPRDCLPAANDRLIAYILAEDGTWHRPFTTYELAALQNLFQPGESFELEGKSDSRWREAIGNCVPPAAAKAIANVMGTTLLLVKTGQTFSLSAQPIWVRPLARAISVNVPVSPAL